MLGQLHIKNIGIIDELTINFENGLNILTGETGAGKSLIIDSINSITGSRISKDIIKTGEDMALVEACFFEENRTDILSREFYKNGRSICKINGRMATLMEIKTLSGSLIDLHGQHDNQSLLNEKSHIELLDKFAGKELQNIKKEYVGTLQEYRLIEKKIKDSYGDPVERARRIDLLKYQKDEIEDAMLMEDEEANLESKRSLIMNSEKIIRTLIKVHDTLDENTINEIGMITHELSLISDLDKKYADTLSTINDTYYSLKDITSDLSRYIEEVSFDEEEQNRVEERLDLIFSIKRKYGNTVQDIFKYLEQISEELDFLENSETIVQDLKVELTKKEEKLEKLAGNLNKIRKEKAKEIENSINKQMKDLEMKNAYVEFEFEKASGFLQEGKDIIRILICTNDGEGLKPLSKIASGGEISRIMLAMKVVLSLYDEIPTMIFDEIDIGISGEAGRAVAEKMKALGKTHQVLAVTHLPVIASAGDANYYIEKKCDNGRTYTIVNKLNEDDVVREIGRILAGKNITQTVFDHAFELRKNMK